MKCTKTLHPPAGGLGKGEKHFIQHIYKCSLMIIRFDHLRGTESPVLALGHFPAKEVAETGPKDCKTNRFTRRGSREQRRAVLPEMEECEHQHRVETSAEVDF